MELSPRITASLEKLKSLDPSSLSALSKAACQAAAGLEPSLEDIKAEPGLAKTAFDALITLFLEAARLDLDDSGLGEFLEESGLPETSVKPAVDSYATARPSIRAALRRSCTGLPHIVDADWRVDFATKNNYVERVNEPTFLVRFKTEAVDGKTEDVSLSCTLAELQDLVSKLKDASNAAHKLAA